jgi:hypothetical protein
MLGPAHGTVAATPSAAPETRAVAPPELRARPEIALGDPAAWQVQAAADLRAATNAWAALYLVYAAAFWLG